MAFIHRIQYSPIIIIIIICSQTQKPLKYCLGKNDDHHCYPCWQQQPLSHWHVGGYGARYIIATLPVMHRYTLHTHNTHDKNENRLRATNYHYHFYYVNWFADDDASLHSPDNHFAIYLSLRAVELSVSRAEYCESNATAFRNAHTCWFHGRWSLDIAKNITNRIFSSGN